MHYTSFWQVKEYRFDRFRDHLTNPQGIKSFFTDHWISLGLLFVMSYAAPDLMVYAIFAYYIYRAGAIGQALYKKTLKRPKFTKKAILIAGITLFMAIGGLIIIDESTWTIWAPALEFAILPLNALVVGMFYPVTLFFKKRAIESATRIMKKRKKLTVIGITGSYGKTSTKQFLMTILSQKYHTFCTPQHVNSEIGIAHLVQRGIPKDAEYFVVEMGAYRIGEIKVMCDMVQPDIGIITAVNEQHLSLFGSLENTMQAKGELIESLSKDGLAIMNADNERCRKMKGRTKVKLHWYSVAGKDSFIKVSHVTQKPQALHFTLTYRGKEYKAEAPLIGEYNVSNIVAAATCALHVGMSMKEIVEAMKDLKPHHRTMEPQKISEKLMCIDDSYNANPESVYAALDYLATVEADTKVLVMPHLRELGKESARIHFDIGKRAANVCDHIIMIEKSYHRDVEQGVESVKNHKAAFWLETDTRKAAQYIRQLESMGNTVVVLEGRGTEKVLKAL